MAQLIVRKLEAEVVARLKERAVWKGRSVEEEHRAILRGPPRHGTLDEVPA